jgi:hypothetical protein
VTAAYDTASQLSNLTYKQASGTVIGDLSYTHDAGGRRTKQSGSLVTRQACPAQEMECQRLKALAS